MTGEDEEAENKTLESLGDMAVANVLLGFRKVKIKEEQ